MSKSSKRAGKFLVSRSLPFHPALSSFPIAHSNIFSENFYVYMQLFRLRQIFRWLLHTYIGLAATPYACLPFLRFLAALCLRSSSVALLNPKSLI